MSASTLANELEAMEPTASEPAAIQAFATAWANYFQNAGAGPIPYVPNPAAKSAMVAAMTGLSVTGAVSIQAGVVAFWGVIAAAAATYFPGAVAATPPPGIAAVAAGLSSTFVANVAGQLDLAASCTVIASVLHTANLGGIAMVLPGPVPAPIL